MEAATSEVFRISVATAVFNERDNVPELLRRIGTVLDRLDGGHEIIVVDDGSSDDTLVILESAAKDEPRLLVISLSRNFGHQPALTAALDHATGDVVVVLDGDLHDPPEAIPLMIDYFGRG